MATIREQIEVFWKQGLTAKVITGKGFKRGTVGATLWRLNHPVRAKEIMDAYNASEKGKDAQKRFVKTEKGKAGIARFRAQHPGASKAWKAAHPEKRLAFKRVNLARHANATTPKATNHRQRWTTRDLGYLERFGAEKSIRQLALDLGRTYAAVQAAGHVYGIALAGDKVGAKGAHFNAIYGTAMPHVAAV